MAPWPSQVELESAAAFNQGGQKMTLTLWLKQSGDLCGRLSCDHAGSSIIAEVNRCLADLLAARARIVSVANRADLFEIASLILKYDHASQIC
jgi:hypothetical protein